MEDSFVICELMVPVKTHLHVTHPVLLLGFMARFLSPSGGDMIAMRIKAAINRFIDNIAYSQLDW